MSNIFMFVLQLTPVERYAVRFLESSGVYITVEQIKAAEVDSVFIVYFLFFVCNIVFICS